MIAKLEFSMPNVFKIHKLEKLCFTFDAWSLNAVRSEFENTFSHIFAYTENDEIVGYAVVREAADELSICNLAVVPNSRQKGIGEALINHLAEFAKNNKNERIVLEVNTQNEPACNLYKKCGFEIAGIRKNFYRQSRYTTRDAYTMVRQITVNK